MRLVFILLSLVILTSCFSEKKTDNTTDRLNENIPAYLDSIIPDMKKFAEKNDTIYDITYHEDGHFLHMVGKIIDEKNIHALLYEEKDTLLNFYHFDITKAEWEKIASERPIWEQVFDISLEDMDGDNRNEIVTFSFPNMNGNRFKEIYYSSLNNKSFHIAASFFTSTYEADKITKTVKTDYYGSWYMPIRKTLYKWYGENLITMKEIVLEPKEGSPMGSEYYLLSYYENTSLKSDSIIDSLTFIYKTPYIKKKHESLWDNFFNETN